MASIKNEEIEKLMKLRSVIDRLLDFETKEPNKLKHPSEYSAVGLVNFKDLTVKDVRAIRDVLISLKDDLDITEAAKKAAEAADKNQFLSDDDMKKMMGDPIAVVIGKEIPKEVHIPQAVKMPDGFGDG